MQEREQEREEGEDLDGQPILGEVSGEAFGVVNGNAVHPDTQDAINNGELQVVHEHSKAGLEGYAKVVRNVAIAAGVITLGAILFEGVRVFRARRRR